MIYYITHKLVCDNINIYHYLIIIIFLFIYKAVQLSLLSSFLIKSYILAVPIIINLTKILSAQIIISKAKFHQVLKTVSVRLTNKPRTCKVYLSQ